MEQAINNGLKVGIRIGTAALGDTIASIPSIRKVSEAYNNKPLTIFTSYPSLFKNHPLVANALPLDDPKDEYHMYNTFNHLAGKEYQLGRQLVSFRHQNMDIRQFHAVSLGFTLTSDEMETDLYSEEEIDLGFNNYVLIHPTKTWASRTWDQENWQNLVDILNKEGIPVVAIGKETTEHGFGITEKPVMDIKIGLGVNLMNNKNISLANIRWMMNNQTKVLVTMDTGILHLAGTTDVHILQLGSSIHPKYRAPYRKGSQNYKYVCVKGSCNEFCASNMKYNVKIHHNIQGNPPLSKCLDNRPSFECHPDYKQVYNVIKQIIK